MNSRRCGVHPAALVSPKAELAAGVEVSPYAIIEDDVKVGAGTKVMAHAYLCSGAEIGSACEIHMGAVIGHLPQILGFDGKIKSGVKIGDRNVFREYSTVHRSKEPNGETIIGNDNYFMAFSHAAHDCIIGSNIVMCNSSLLAGHVVVEDRAFISANSAVQQFSRIGKLAMIGGLTRVTKDVPPFMLAEGDSVISSYNLVGLRRAGYDGEARERIKRAYKVLYKDGHSVSRALEILESEPHEEIKYLVEFIRNSKRGICRHKSQDVRTYYTYEAEGRM